MLIIRSLIRHVSAFANRKLEARELSHMWSENKYLSKYFEERFGKMDLLPSPDKTYPIYTSIDRLKGLTAQKEKMDYIEYGRLIQTEFKEFAAQLKLMNQKEIAALLNDLKNDHGFTSRWSTKLIDFELRWILKSYLGTGLMDMDLSLYLAHIFYTANIRSTYVSILIKHLSQNVQSMTNEQLIFSLFLAMLTRQSTPMLANYHEQIKDIVREGSMQDIATICMTYFKTKTKIDDMELFDLIVDRLIELLPQQDPSEPGYCAIIKCIRYSQCYERRQKIQSLVDAIDKQANILTSSYNIVHTLKLMETYRIYDDKIFQSIYKIFMSHMDQFRIKDIQYVMTSLSNFSFNNLTLSEDDKAALDVLCKQIANKTRDDVDKQHMHAIPLMRALALFGYYSQDLARYIDKSLNNSNLYTDMSNTLEFDRSLLALHVAFKMEAGIEPFPSNRLLLSKISASMKRSGNISGTIINDKSLNHLSFIINDNKSNLTISNSVRNIGMELATRPDILERYKLSFQVTFPHQNYGDLILTTDSKNPGNFDARTLMPAKVSEGQTHILIMALTKYDFIDGDCKLSGFKTFLERLARKGGYGVVTVNLNDFNLSELVEKIKSIKAQGISVQTNQG